jgi:hypothetical protein
MAHGVWKALNADTTIFQSIAGGDWLVTITNFGPDNVNVQFQGSPGPDVPLPRFETIVRAVSNQQVIIKPPGGGQAAGTFQVEAR